ncbi:MAG: hypothetical protein JWM04_2470 [Verrucomicrobiales bacterium]|nr:hypothetical protein [Verrucomicrobiales bacterium]
MRHEAKKEGSLTGYARVSTTDQNHDSQLDELKKAGCHCKSLYIDTLSDGKAERPGLAACLNDLQKGDTLVVWRLDLLGRSFQPLIDIVEALEKKAVGLKSLRDGVIDTTTASGKLIFHVFTAIAEFERTLIRELTVAGLTAARARGRFGGRRRILASDPRVRMVKDLHANRSVSIDDACKNLNMSRPTFYRLLSLANRAAEKEKAAAPAVIEVKESFNEGMRRKLADHNRQEARAKK